jgi:hypothetical protein
MYETPGDRVGAIMSEVPGSGEPATPEMMLKAAVGIAGLLIGMPESTKDSALVHLKKTNAVMHTLVKSRMQEMRDEAGPGTPEKS